MLRFSLQQVFRNELETQHFHYKQKAKDAAVWGLHSGRKVASLLYTTKNDFAVLSRICFL